MSQEISSEHHLPSCEDKITLGEDGVVSALAAGQADRTGGSPEPQANLQGQSDFDRAVAEWDVVQEVVPTLKKEAADGTDAPSFSRKLVTFSDVREYCDSLDKASLPRREVAAPPRNVFSKLYRLLFGPPELHRNLKDERELVLCLASMPFDDGTPFHFHVLQTIYRKLTGSSIDCSRYGAHWECIGFQGSDPATDLRGAGLLGLVNMLYFLVEPKYARLYQKIFELSCHEIQNYPFCVVSINLTGMALRALRQDLLNKECNKRGSVLPTFNEFYVWAFLRWHDVWKSGNKTIADAGLVIKEVEVYCHEHVHEASADLQARTTFAIPTVHSEEAVPSSKCCKIGLRPKSYQVIDVIDVT